MFVIRQIAAGEKKNMSELLFCFALIIKSEILSFSSLFLRRKNGFPEGGSVKNLCELQVASLGFHALHPSWSDDAGEPSLESWGDHGRETFTFYPRHFSSGHQLHWLQVSLPTDNANMIVVCDIKIGSSFFFKALRSDYRGPFNAWGD